MKISKFLTMFIMSAITVSSFVSCGGNDDSIVSSGSNDEDVVDKSDVKSTNVFVGIWKAEYEKDNMYYTNQIVFDADNHYKMNMVSVNKIKDDFTELSPDNLNSNVSCAGNYVISSDGSNICAVFDFFDSTESVSHVYSATMDPTNTDQFVMNGVTYTKQ